MSYRQKGKILWDQKEFSIDNAFLDIMLIVKLVLARMHLVSCHTYVWWSVASWMQHYNTPVIWSLTTVHTAMQHCFQRQHRLPCSTCSNELTNHGACTITNYRQPYHAVMSRYKRARCWVRPNLYISVIFDTYYNVIMGGLLKVSSVYQYSHFLSRLMANCTLISKKWCGQLVYALSRTAHEAPPLSFKSVYKVRVRAFKSRPELYVGRTSHGYD